MTTNYNTLDYDKCCNAIETLKDTILKSTETITEAARVDASIISGSKISLVKERLPIFKKSAIKIYPSQSLFMLITFVLVAMLVGNGLLLIRFIGMLTFNLLTLFSLVGLMVSFWYLFPLGKKLTSRLAANLSREKQAFIDLAPYLCSSIVEDLDYYVSNESLIKARSTILSLDYEIDVEEIHLIELAVFLIDIHSMITKSKESSEFEERFCISKEEDA